MEVVRFEKAAYGYSQGIQVIKDVTFAVKEGEMILVMGKTGSGKTTLLNMIHAKLKESAVMVKQNPGNQIVCDSVWEEMAFGLSCHGQSDENIEGRIAETAEYFGISRWLNLKTRNLSGGEKQILNLACAMTVEPKVLLLDEPTSMLDPVMSHKFIDAVRNLNQELGITVIMTSHDTEQIIDDIDRIILVDQGKVKIDEPKKIIRQIAEETEMKRLLPCPSQIFCCEAVIPLAINEGKKLAALYSGKMKKLKREETSYGKKILECSHLFFSYEKNSNWLINDLSMEIREGEIFSVLGGNGSGKSTLAMLLAGYLRPYSGTVRIEEKKTTSYKSSPVRMLFQDVQVHFNSDDAGEKYGHMHPYDLSGGQKQLLALDIVLEDKPKFLVLDEPSKGLDGIEKAKLAARLDAVRRDGCTLIMVTHDVEFAAKISDRMGILFDGKLTNVDKPVNFCRKNMFYTTGTARIFKGLNDEVITVEDAVRSLYE